MPEINPSSTKIPPAALPKTPQDQLDWLRLYRSRRVGPMTFIRMIREHGTARNALAALPELAAQSGVKGYVPFPLEAAERELENGQQHGAKLLCLGATDYPPLLATISDPPAVLWALGDPEIAKRPCIALVGARNASSLGRRMAARLGHELSQAGYIVVSGMARGIDTEAHNAALTNGTIAVQAGGVDIIYPKENNQLAMKIAENGLRLAEMAIGIQPQARHFPRRNRIISGLAQAVVVIEGASRSGSLITAKDALDQGREVMAVPGNPMDARAAGCNMLIRDGATLVRSADDIIAALPPPVIPLAPEPTVTPPPETKNLPDVLLALLGPVPVPEDILIRQVNSAPQQVLSALVDLEIAKKIERHLGGVISTAA